MTISLTIQEGEILGACVDSETLQIIADNKVVYSTTIRTEIEALLQAIPADAVARLMGEMVG